MQIPEGQLPSLRRWQNEAARMVRKTPHPELSIAVLQRTLQMATRNMVLRVEDVPEPRTSTFDESVVLPTRGLRGAEAIELAQQLDADLLAKHPDLADVLDEEKEETRTMPHVLGGAAITLHHHCGERVAELTSMLVPRLLTDANKELMETWSTLTDMAPSLRNNIVNIFLRDNPHEDSHDREILGYLLGEGHYERLLKRCGTNEKILERLLAVLNRSSHIRSKLFFHLRSTLEMPDRLLAASFIRRGWKELMDMDAPSEREWWIQILEELLDLEGRQDDFEGQCPTEELKEKHARMKQRARDFINADAGKDDPLEKLSTVIHCNRHRAELLAFEDRYDWKGYAAKQRAILAEVVGAMARFPYDDEKDDLTAARVIPPYIAGTPRNVMERKRANCFSGPWLMAMLLLRCGFREDEILYLHANQMTADVKGSHGGLLVATRAKELLYADYGYNVRGANFPLKLLEEENMTNTLTALADGVITGPVMLRFHKDVADCLEVPIDMQAMSLTQGLMSGHMLNVAISFVHEERWEEAEHACFLGLTFNPRDPDLHYYHGLALQALGREAQARRAFLDGIDAYEGHLRCHFALGELLRHQGRVEEALQEFKRVVNDPADVWDDPLCKPMAMGAYGACFNELYELSSGIFRKKKRDVVLN